MSGYSPSSFHIQGDALCAKIPVTRHQDADNCSLEKGCCLHRNRLSLWEMFDTYIEVVEPGHGSVEERISGNPTGNPLWYCWRSLGVGSPSHTHHAFFSGYENPGFSPVLWAWPMVTPIGFTPECCDFFEQTIKVRAQGLTSIRMNVGEVPYATLSVVTIFFNTIWQKSISCSLSRRLKKPLETLSITCCHLIQRDLDYLPQCLNLSELKHLYLSYTILEEFKPLGKLLERVKDTLQTLDLEHCWLEDSAFSDFMPALRQCSQLLKINFVDNKLSLPLLKQLLQRTAKLNKLTQELYPVPLECYDNRGLVIIERFDEICPELLDILRSKRQPKAVSFVSTICCKCFRSCVYDLESRHCLCWQ